MHEFIAKEITVAYRGGARAVREFDLGFSGDCLGVVGLEADGKTTLINALAGLTPYSGEFFLDGEQLEKTPKGDCVQAVLEDYCLLKNKTVYDNILYPLKLRGMSAPEAHEKADGVIKEYGLGGYADVKAKKLAENIKPYVAVARLSLIPRKLYLFDDILKPLKKEHKNEFLLKLKELFFNLGGMKIYATSDIFEAAALCDKIVILYGGVIEQYGTSAELYENPLSVRVAEIMSGGKVNFGHAILREMNGRLTVRISGEEITLPEDSRGRLLDKAYIGKEVLAAQYSVYGEPKCLVMDAETDKTIFF